MYKITNEQKIFKVLNDKGRDKYSIYSLHASIFTALCSYFNPLTKYASLTEMNPIKENACSATGDEKGN